MNWSRYFTNEMLEFYSRVAVGSAKASTLRESVRDVAFVYELHAWFLADGGGESTALPFTVRAITELIEQGWMQLCMYREDQTLIAVNANVDELFRIVANTEDAPPHHVLIPTEKGLNWVRRFNEFLSEIHPNAEQLEPRPQ